MEWRTVEDAAEWEAWLADWRGAPPTQGGAWAALKAPAGYAALRLAVLDEDGRPAVLGQVLRRRIPVIGRNWLYCPYGPLWREEEPEALRVWMEALRGHPFARRAAVLTVEPRREAGDACEGLLRELGLRPGKQAVQPRATLLLDLTVSEEELRAGLEPHTRYNIGLAERRGVVVERDDSPAGVERFLDLLEETMDRQHFLSHDREYYRRVWREFGERGAAEILLASFDGEPVAGVWLLFAGGEASYYCYGASSGRHAKHKGTQYLQWRAILRAKERGCRSYDFWGAPVAPHEKHPLWGVYQFKKGFGGRHTVFTGPWELTLALFSGWVWRVGLPAARRLRNLLVRGRTADVLD